MQYNILLNFSSRGSSPEMSESGLEIVAARRFVAIDLITKIILLEMMLRMMEVVMGMTF